MRVLVDRSVWVARFKRRDPHLVALLEAGRVVCHPYVVVELACGTPPRRAEIIEMLSELESAPMATPAELLGLIRRRALFGRGCGFVDVGLLASALLQEVTRLWTLDQRLEVLALELDRAYRPALAS